jgi:hypothetical protein
MPDDIVLFDRSWYNRAGVECDLPDRVHNPAYLRGPIAKQIYAPAVY